MGVDTKMKKVVPLGYDYECDKSTGCADKYSSFNSDK